MTPTIVSKIVKIAQDHADFSVETQEHFSFLIDRNKVIAWGKNKKYRTHPIARRFGHRFFAIHSELSAINDFPYPIKKLKDYDLVNIRINKKHRIMLAKPCMSCMKMLLVFQPKSIWFSNNLGQFEEIEPCR